MCLYSILVLVHYHKKEYFHSETGQLFEGQGHHDSKTEHFCQCSISKPLQWLCFLLHIQKINGERKPNIDLWVKWSKVNLPATLWLLFISDRISLRLLITDASNFVKRWRMMIGKHPEHQRTKKLLVKVTYKCFPIELCAFVIFVNFASISAPYMQFVIKVGWTFYVFPSHQLFYMHSTRKVRNRASHAFPSNRPTEVSLHWTWFKVGTPTQKQQALLTNAKKKCSCVS